MNLLRTLTSHQVWYLELICKGEIVLLWNADEKHYVRQGSNDYIMVMPNNKPWPKKNSFRSRRPWLGSVVVELKQRGVLVDVDGRLMPSKAAVKLFGAPAKIEPPKRVVKMSRTRAARVQGDH